MMREYLRELERAIRGKYENYRTRLSFVQRRSLFKKSSSTPTISNIKVRPADVMGSLERYGFSQEIPPSNGYGDDEESCCTNCFSNINCNALPDEDTLHMEFFRNTSLHGLKYIGQSKKHFIERIFWSIAFITGLVVAYYMISEVYVKYSNNSVIITFAPFDTKISELPFPAITICNMNKVRKSKALQFMKESMGPSRKEGVRAARENLYYLNHVCSSSKSFTRAFNYSANRGKIDQFSLQVTNSNENNYEGGKEDVWQFFLEASPLCRDLILKCTWQEEIKNCSELFTEIETDYGKCCTFNMAPPEVLHRFNSTSVVPENDWWKWDGESLLKKPKVSERKPNSKDNTQPTSQEAKEANGFETPKRQKVPGKSFGLSILLNPDLDEYFCSTSDSVGFRLATHLPIDVPHISDLGSAIKPNSEVFINIRPELTIGVKEAIKGFSLANRQCYFNEEHKLGYYNYYSSSNCIDECIANLTYQECNCRRHYQPGDDSKPLCGPKQFQCASSIKKKFVGNYKTQCKMCISTCTEVIYHTETTYTTLQAPEILWTDNNNNLAPWAYKNVSIVHIYFGEGSTNAKLRKELYGTVDLIANFGGLMGLCLGFSGLSLVEVIYFLTLRAWCRVRRKRHEKKIKSHEKHTRWNNAGTMQRSDTTTELLKNEIDCIPVYKSPQHGYGKRVIGGAGVNDKRKKERLNHILYTVAFSHNQERN